MPGTVTLHEAEPAPFACGLRVIGEQRTISLLEWDGRQRFQGLTVGRRESSYVWLSHPTVSELHAMIEIVAPAPGSLPPAFEIQDAGSKNGTCVSRLGAHGPFVRVPEVRLEVGRYLRLGAVVLAVLDWATTFPTMTREGVR